MTTTATTYMIRVEGQLDDHWTDWLGALDMTCDDDGITAITVEVADQAQLHGVLAGLRDIGAVISELRTGQAPVRSFRPAIERPLHTERLTLRAATADDAAATWKYRRLDSVNEWLTGGPADPAAYCELFPDPDRLAATVIVALRDDPTGRIIGDFMLRRGDAWAQHEVAGRAWLSTLVLFDVVDPGSALDVVVVPEIIWEAGLGFYPSSRDSGRRRRRTPPTCT